MIRSFLDLSTAHLSPATRAWLDEQGTIAAAYRLGTDPFPALLIGSTPYGWFVWADEAAATGGPEPGIPVDLWAVMAAARRQGADYILFDADAEAVDYLPTFEDEAETAAEVAA